MKTEILKLISASNRSKVENLLDEVLSFYGSIDLSFSTSDLSEFFRDVDFSSTPWRAKGRIIISEHNDMESAIVHELLHLRIALNHKVYALYFPGNYDKRFVSGLQNVVEHELMINDFIELGYSIDRFLANSFNPIDYKREKLLNEPAFYWIYEYLRLTFNLLVIDEKLKDDCRKQITEVRKIALKKCPGIEDDFRSIREWHVSKKFHDYSQYPQELKKLFGILKEPRPIKYLIPMSEGSLQEMII